MNKNSTCPGKKRAWAGPELPLKTLPFSIIPNPQRLPGTRAQGIPEHASHAGQLLTQSQQHNWALDFKYPRCYKSWSSQGLRLTLRSPLPPPKHPIVQRVKHCLWSLQKHRSGRWGIRELISEIYQPNKYKYILLTFCTTRRCVSPYSSNHFKFFLFSPFCIKQENSSVGLTVSF